MGTSDEIVFEHEEFSLGIAIKLMDNRLSGQRDAIDTMKSTGRTLLGSSSLIVSLLGTLQLINTSVIAKYICAFNLMLIIAMSAFLI